MDYTLSKEPRISVEDWEYIVSKREHDRLKLTSKSLDFYWEVKVDNEVLKELFVNYSLKTKFKILDKVLYSEVG